MMGSKDMYYRGAIALNNIGVDLLHRHFYPQAAETLRDAIRCMNFHRTIRSKNQEVQPAPLKLQAILQHANHRLALSSQLPHIGSGKGLFPIAGFRVGCPLLFSGLVHRNPELLSLLCPARVDDFDFSCGTNNESKDCCEDDVFEFQTASFVMNLGLASFCIAESRGDGTMMQVVRLFEMSYSILDRFCSARSNALAVREVAQMKLVLVLGLLRANQRVEISLVLVGGGAPMHGYNGKLSRKSLQGRLEQLMATIQSTERLHTSFMHGLNCATAA